MKKKMTLRKNGTLMITLRTTHRLGVEGPALCFVHSHLYKEYDVFKKELEKLTSGKILRIAKQELNSYHLDDMSYAVCDSSQNDRLDEAAFVIKRLMEGV